MALWFVLAMMTAAAVFAVLWPLSRSVRVDDCGSETAVYKDQLAEISRDVNSGMLAPADAESARIEIARRLLAADDAQRDAPVRISRGWRRAVAMIALIGLPLSATALYISIGAPQLPDQPLTARLSPPSASEPLDRLVAQVEAHLERNPADGRGWAVLAPVLMQLARYEDAVRALRNAMQFAGESAERRADLGEALAAAANGVVTAESKTEFERAFAMDATAVKPRYFLGLAAEQDGRKTDAAAIWRALLASAAPDAPWRGNLQASLARVEGGAFAPALSDDALSSVAGMADGERGEMIRGMVDRLATRLKSAGDDPDGWLRLVRAYMVLGERERALGARRDARQALASNNDALRQFNERVAAFGLDG